MTEQDEQTPGPLGPRPLDGDEPPHRRFDLERLQANVSSRVFGVDRQPAPVKLGRFVILDRIGKGGMGTVYAAYDPGLDRKVALKVLRPDRADGRATERLLNEARAAAQLSHPNVVTVYEVGLVGDEVFIAMEHVEGETLRRWLQREPERSWRGVVTMFGSIGRGLAAAHAAGLVHRDFKPENVLIGADGRARVIDFGVARGAMHADSEHDAVEATGPGEHADAPTQTERGLAASLTRTGSVVGTPAYMAPEQFAGGPIDARADQFAFCVALWEALHGQRPFAGKTTEALQLAVAEGAVGDPAKSAVPRAVTNAVRRGLAVDPAERHASIRALLAALQRAEARSRRTLTVVAAAAAVLLGVLAWGGWQLDLERRRAQCRDDASEITEVWNGDVQARLREALLGTGVSYAETTFARALPFVDAHVQSWQEHYADLCIATRVVGARTDEQWASSRMCLADRRGELEALLVLLTEESDTTSVQRTVPAVAGLGRLELCGDDQWLARNPAPADSAAEAQAAEVRQGLQRAAALRAAGRYDDGLALARELCNATADNESARLRAKALLSAGGLAALTGAFEDAEGLVGEAFDIAVGAGEDDLGLIAATNLVFVVGVDLERHKEGQVWGRIAQVLHARGGSVDELAAARLHEHLGDVYLSQGLYAPAERALEQALTSREQVLGADHPHLASLHSNLGAVLNSQGRYAEAERAHIKALAIEERALGPDHPELVSSHGNLGLLYASQGRYPKAENELDLAVAISERALGSDHPRVARSLNNLGGVYRAQGRYEEAERVHKQALAILEVAFGPDHPGVASAQHNLGAVYASQRRNKEAEHALGKALAAWEHTLGPDHPEVARALTNLGVVYRSQRRYDDAERAYTRALAIREEALDPDHPHVARTLNNLGNLYASQRRYEEAERAHGRALAVREQAFGPDHREVANSLVELAAAELALGRSSEAVGHADRAVALRIRHTVAAVVLADAKFVLAQALWVSKQDRARARTLAEQARDAYSATGEAEAEAIAEVTQWLRRHPLQAGG